MDPAQPESGKDTRGDQDLYAAKENGRNQVVCCHAINPAKRVMPPGTED